MNIFRYMDNTAFAEEVINNCVHDTIVLVWKPLPKPYKEEE